MILSQVWHAPAQKPKEYNRKLQSIGLSFGDVKVSRVSHKSRGGALEQLLIIISSSLWPHCFPHTAPIPPLPSPPQPSQQTSSIQLRQHIHHRPSVAVSPRSNLPPPGFHDPTTYSQSIRINGLNHMLTPNHTRCHTQQIFQEVLGVRECEWLPMNCRVPKSRVRESLHKSCKQKVPSAIMPYIFNKYLSQSGWYEY